MFLIPQVRRFKCNGCVFDKLSLPHQTMIAKYLFKFVAETAVHTKNLTKQTTCFPFSCCGCNLFFKFHSHVYQHSIKLVANICLSTFVIPKTFSAGSNLQLTNIKCQHNWHFQQRFLRYRKIVDTVRIQWICNPTHERYGTVNRIVAIGVVVTLAKFPANSFIGNIMFKNLQ